PNLYVASAAARVDPAWLPAVDTDAGQVNRLRLGQGRAGADPRLDDSEPRCDRVRRQDVIGPAVDAGGGAVLRPHRSRTRSTPARSAFGTSFSGRLPADRARNRSSR